MAKQRQYMIKGTDTDLSNACDEYLEALSEVEKAKDHAMAAEERMADIMKRLAKNSVRHSGRTMYLRRGRTIKDSVIIKREDVRNT